MNLFRYRERVIDLNARTVLSIFVWPSKSWTKIAGAIALRPGPLSRKATARFGRAGRAQPGEFRATSKLGLIAGPQALAARAPVP